MRVTILSREFPPATSGIGDHTDKLAAELTRRGLAVSVVTSTGAESRDAFAVHGVIERWDARGRRAIVAAVAATNPDVILWQYNPFSFGRRGIFLSAGRLARALASVAPLALFAHELWFPWGRAGGKGIAWAIAHRLQGRGVLRAATRWVVTTESRVRELARIDAGKVRRIPVGANVEPTKNGIENVELPADEIESGKGIENGTGNGTGGGMRTEAARARAAMGIPAGAFVVAHLGSVAAPRDLGPVFEAVGSLRARGIDARLILAGNTGPFHKPANLNGSVLTTGTLPPGRLSVVLRAADAYVHTDPAGASAGRRGSLVAALAHGLPVVAYRGPDHAPQLADGRNVLLVERDGAAMTGALRGIAGDPGAARRIGEAARQTFEQTFAWDRIGDETISVLKECAR